jgi:hypothetical protein
MDNFLFDFLQKLYKHQVDFVICGGIACVLQGCERTTYDLDIALLMSKKNLDRFIDVVKASQLIPRIPEPLEYLSNESHRTRWMEEKNALVYTVLDQKGLLQVDVLLSYPIEYTYLRDRADLFEVEDCTLLVSSIVDLLRAKKQITPLRRKDQEDIAILTELLHAQAKK